MSNKSRDEAIDDLKDKEAPEEAKQEAHALAEQHTSSSGGSGSVVTKYQLCGKYCGGCPHGPYAWLVGTDGWHYLGKVGSETQGDSTDTSTEQSNTAGDDGPLADIDVPEWVDETSVSQAAANMDIIDTEWDDGTLVIRGEEVVVAIEDDEVFINTNKDSNQDIRTDDQEAINAALDVIAGFPDDPNVNGVNLDHQFGHEIVTDEGTFKAYLKRDYGEDAVLDVAGIPSAKLENASDAITRRRRLTEYDRDSIPSSDSVDVSMQGFRTSQHGEKLAVDIDYEDKDDLKNLALLKSSESDMF